MDIMDISLVEQIRIEGRNFPMVRFDGGCYVPASDEELLRIASMFAIGEYVAVDYVDHADPTSVWIEPIKSAYGKPTTLSRML